MRVLISLVIGAWLALGCSEAKDEETPRLIERVSAIDIEASPETRRRQVRELGELELADQELRDLRDLCVEGNEALLGAEASQGEAATRLAEVTESLGDGPIPREQAQTIEAAIAESTAELERARELLNRCQSDVRRLDIDRSLR